MPSRENKLSKQNYCIMQNTNKYKRYSPFKDFEYEILSMTISNKKSKGLKRTERSWECRVGVRKRLGVLSIKWGGDGSFAACFPLPLLPPPPSGIRALQGDYGDG